MRDPLEVSDFRCDCHRCHFPSIFEIYPNALIAEEHCWYYFCFYHFLKYRVWKGGFGWCLAEWVTRIPLVSRIWNWWAK